MTIKDKLQKRLLNNIDITRELSDEDLNEIIVDMVCEEYLDAPIPLKEKLKISKELFHAIRGLDILEDLLADEEITEIMINDHQNIFIEKKGVLYRHHGAFSSPEKLQDVIQTIVAKANKRVNEASPIVDTRLPDGSRVNVVLNPISIAGPAVTIRKFSRKTMTMEELIRLDSITEEAACFLKELVEYGYNIFISGGTGSGKTTFLNILSNYIPKEERIITIEDSAELNIKGVDNLVSLECRQANEEGENAVTIRDLIRTSLRMRPNRIIVGEVRGEETLDMLQAMNTGHDGSLSTGHANSAEDMLTRMEMMVLMATEIPLAAVRQQIASAIEVMVHLGRLRDGSRKVLAISEVLGVDGDRIRMNPLFLRDPQDGRLKPTGNTMIRTGKGGSFEYKE